MDLSNIHKNTSLSPPPKRRNVFSDIKYFFLNKPPFDTNINLKNKEERNTYQDSIMQRTGMAVEDYKILNIHRIGINVLVGYLMDELMS